MKIIIDDKIPYIKEAAEKIAEEVIYAPGKDFTRELVQDADALSSGPALTATANCWKAAK